MKYAMKDNFMKILYGAVHGLSFGILLGMIQCGLDIGCDFGIVGAVVGVLLFLSCCGFPLIVSQILLYHTKNSISQVIFSGVILLYGIGILGCECYILSFLRGTQYERLILFSGLVSLPALLPLWLTAYIIERRYRKQNNPSLNNLPKTDIDSDR